MERASLDSISSESVNKTASVRSGSNPSQPLLVPVFLICIAAFLVVAPFFYFGIPSGHDFEFHMNSWMETLAQWKQGVFYPRWAGLAHYGYGEARFLFYPPASWMLGAALGAVMPWTWVSGAYTWIALSLSGISMFLLARRWLPCKQAVFAAIFYAANPYFLVVVYWRSAFAELLAGAFIPLIVWAIVRAEEGNRRVVIPLALIVAAAWLTNVPSAVMVTYSVMFLVLVFAVFRRSPKMLAVGAAGIVLGGLLAAFYLVPAIYEQKWINIFQVVSEGLRPQDNFLFANTSDNDHNIFNHLVSIVAISEILALALVGFWTLGLKRIRSSSITVITLWAGVISISMLPATIFFWNHLPELRYLQFPWRWLLCMNLPLAILAAQSWKRFIPRVVLYIALLGVVVYVWHTILPPWWNKTADIIEMQDNQESGAGYEGTDEYVPRGGDSYDLQQDAPKIRYTGSGSATFEVQRWDNELKGFAANATEPGQLVLRLFNYPAWQVTVNGRVTPVAPESDNAQMMIPVQAGHSVVEIKFTRTWDRTAGAILSALTVTFLIIMIFWQRGTHGKKVAHS
ncbi:MAG TPA: 6-pyruvoyl-tetrahydropterin synthase-related protein [Terriglobales bacterium]